MASVLSVPGRVAPATVDETRKRKSNTAWSRFRRDRVAGAGLVVLGIVVSLAITAPLFAADPFSVDLDAVKKPPNAAHWLGTDSAGRDVLARLFHGARVSMSVGIAAVAVATCVGTLVGLTSGYGGGKIDNFPQQDYDNGVRKKVASQDGCKSRLAQVPHWDVTQPM